MIDTRLLNQFAAIMRHGSFVAAAQDLGVSQSTMTKNIARLESQLDLRLFNRTTRRVEPTDSARRLLPAAEATLQAASALLEEARLLSGGDLGTLRVGVIALASDILIADTLAWLAQRHPELEIEVIIGSADIYRDLATGECDVAIGDEVNFNNSPFAQALRKVPLRTEPIVLVHHDEHPDAGNLAQLVKNPLVLPSRYYNENHLFAAFRTQGGPDRPRYRLNSLASCLGLAARTGTITLAPRSALQNSPLPLTASPYTLDMEIQLVMVSPASHSPTPAMRAFHAALSTSSMSQ